MRMPFQITSLMSLCLFFLPALSHADLSWQRIGLEGVEVTALSKSNYGAYKGLLVGTNGQGVYLYRDADFVRIVQQEEIDTATVYCLAARSDTTGLGRTIYAGTNIGLYAFTEFSGPPHSWLLVEEIPITAVMAMHVSDSTLFVSAGMNIYRSISPWGITAPWDTVLDPDFFLPLRAFPSFRSFASEPGMPDTVYAGSIFWGPMDSWSGMVGTFDGGTTWEIRNDGWTGAAPSISAMALFLPIFSATRSTHYVGTPQGVYYRDSTDTTWKVSGLEQRSIRQLYMAFTSRSLIATVYVATDSGVFSGDTNSGWNGPGSGLSELAVNALFTNKWVDSDSLYAGTANGLYVYTDHGTIKTKNTPPLPALHTINLFIPSCRGNAGTKTSFSIVQGTSFTLAFYTPSGRLIKSIHSHPSSTMPEGIQTIQWNAQDTRGNPVPNGLYLCRLQSGETSITRALLLAR